MEEIFRGSRRYPNVGSNGLSDNGVYGSTDRGFTCMECFPTCTRYFYDFVYPVRELPFKLKRESTYLGSDWKFVPFNEVDLLDEDGSDTELFDKGHPPLEDY